MERAEGILVQRKNQTLLDLKALHITHFGDTERLINLKPTADEMVYKFKDTEICIILLVFSACGMVYVLLN